MSAPTVVQYADLRAPSGESAPTAPQQLADTGAAESHNATPLTVGEFATLFNGAEPIRVSFRSAPALADGQVTAADVSIGPHVQFRWLVTERDKHVYAEAADGSSAYEASVWTSSGPRAES